jgi:hypothetical protein
MVSLLLEVMYSGYHGVGIMYSGLVLDKEMGMRAPTLSYDDSSKQGKESTVFGVIGS